MGTLLLAAAAAATAVVVLQLAATVTGDEISHTNTNRNASRQCTASNETRSILAELRRIMATSAELNDRPIDALYVTSRDEYQTETRNGFIHHLTNRSDPSAVLIVTDTTAAYFTDAATRPGVAATLDCSLETHATANVADWLRRLRRDGRIGVDARRIGNAEWERLEGVLRGGSGGGGGWELVELKVDVVGAVWKGGEGVDGGWGGGLVDGGGGLVGVVEFGEGSAGKFWQTKIEEVRQKINEQRANAMVITSLDEIAWLFNLKAIDSQKTVKFIPSHVILTEDTVSIYIDAKNLPIFNQINGSKPIVKRTEHFYQDLKTESQKYTFLVPPDATRAVFASIPAQKRIQSPSPIQQLKSTKTEAEIAAMERAQIIDSAAMCKFFAAFHRKSTETDLTSTQLTHLLADTRRTWTESLGPTSPPAVTFTGPATPNATQTRNTPIIVRAAWQYTDGATEVARTVHLGSPDYTVREVYTRMVVGMMQLANLVFPESVRFSSADVIARAPFWEVGLDYSGEVGHEIGTFVGSRRKRALRPGYFLVNDLSYYSENGFGVNLANVLLVIKTPWVRPGFGKFYGFKVLTLVPFDLRLLDLSLLTRDDRLWLNKYNADIRQLVGSELMRQKEIEAFYWMMNQTKYIPVHGSTLNAFARALSVLHLILIAAVTAIFL